MRSLKSKILAGALALTASPLFALAQAPQNPPPPPGPNGQRWQRGDGRMNVRPRRHHRRHRRHRRAPVAMLLRNPAFREKLGITPEQAAKIQTQQSNFMKEMIRNRADIEIRHLELAELMAADKPDRALLEKKLREVNDAEFAARKAELENQLAMREAFTPEQREKLRQMMGEFRMHQMQDGWGPGRGMRGPDGQMGPRGPMGPRRPPQGPPGDDSGLQ